MKVVKFGGSSLASATQFKKVHDIVLEDTDRHYVVPSAPGKRNKEDTKLKENFDEWKKSAQAEIKKFKQNIITDEELYNWMIKHK